MPQGGFLQTSTHALSSRGVFDEAISRVPEKSSATVLVAGWASPLLRGATSLIAPCRRPRPVGAMTKKKRAARFGGSTHTSTGLSMSGGRGSPEIPRFFIRRSSIPRSSIRHLTFGIRHFPKTSCAPPTQCCMLQPKSRTSTIPWRVCKDALSRSVSMTGFFFCG